MASNFNLTNLVFAIITLATCLSAAMAIANFFDLNISVFGPYLAWMIAIFVFVAVLPERVGTMFN